MIDVATSNSGPDSADSRSAPHRVFFWLLAAAWTLAVLLSLGWNLVHNASEAYLMAKRTAQAVLQKDLLYRQWSILNGAVYVPKHHQEDGDPNRNDPERDIVTPSGEWLTLLNPAVVSRQIFALQDQNLGVKGKITSLDPIRPSNSPDGWERQGLQEFNKHVEEVNTVETRDGKRYFRIMRPLIIVPSCLRCHEEQGRKVGEIRGGISVTVPMEHYSARGENLHLAVAHLGLWSLGLAGMVLGLKKLEHHSSQRLQAEARTRAALKEKEALLQEIHHRVKNNLQVISSLLQLQTHEIKDPTTLAIFRDSQLRIKSMALIHEKLYESDSFERVDLADYLRSLTHLLFSTYGNHQNQLKLELDLEPASIGLDTAIPLGLIANELITNSLKFAFPDDQPGVIRVELRNLPGSSLRVVVSDNGVGLPAGFNIQKSKSLGMRLVRMLAGQLEAESSWDTKGVGTSFTLQFQDKTGSGVIPNTGPGRAPAPAKIGDTALMGDRPNPQPSSSL